MMNINQQLNEIIRILEADFNLRRQGLQRTTQGGLHAFAGAALGGILGRSPDVASGQATPAVGPTIQLSSVGPLLPYKPTVTTTPPVRYGMNPPAATATTQATAHATATTQATAHATATTQATAHATAPPTVTTTPPVRYGMNPPAPVGYGMNPPAPVGYGMNPPAVAPTSPVGPMPPSYTQSIDAGVNAIIQGGSMLEQLKSNPPASTPEWAALNTQLQELATTLSEYDAEISKNVDAFKQSKTDIPQELIDLDLDIQNLRTNIVDKLESLGKYTVQPSLIHRRRIRHDMMMFPQAWNMLPQDMQQGIMDKLDAADKVYRKYINPVSLGFKPPEGSPHGTPGGLSAITQGVTGFTPMKLARMGLGATAGILINEARKASLKNSGGGIMDYDSARKQAQAGAQHPGGFIREGAGIAQGFSMSFSETAGSIGRALSIGTRVFG
jgi:hypothetical protein